MTKSAKTEFNLHYCFFTFNIDKIQKLYQQAIEYKSQIFQIRVGINLF